MASDLPHPSDDLGSRADLLLGYLDFFRSVVATKLDGLGEADLRGSRLPSGWSPLELVVHLTHVERRWLVWGFLGEPVAQPWGDERDGRWYADPDRPVAELLEAWRVQAERTRQVVAGHGLEEVGAPGPRWEGRPPASLERVLLHLVQEYARHCGHLDVVRELVDGTTGEG